MIQTTTYNVTINLEQPIKAAFVSDLHDRCPDEVLELLKAEQPDLILVGGDTMERYEPGQSEWTLEEMNRWQGVSKSRSFVHNLVKRMDGSLPGQAASEKPKKWKMENGRRFLMEVSQICPVVMSIGNHEWYYLDEDYEVFEKYHINLLDNSFVELNIKGNQLTVGGLSTRYDRQWLKEFAGKPGKKILLSHHPEYVLRYVGKTYYHDFALILSGHAHGGQWRIPAIKKGGRTTSVFAPGQGAFPKYAYGRFGHWIIGAGVSNTSSIPRWGNPCELVILQMK